MVTYDIVPGAKVAASHKLDFGSLQIASKAKLLGGFSNVETIMKGDPELITEILKVEPI